jgi:hypothetical protein
VHLLAGECEDAGAWAAVEAAMRRFPNSPAIQELGSEALLRLAPSADDIRELEEARSFEDIVDAMHSYLRSATVQWQCAAAIANLSRCSDEYAARLSALGAVKAVVAAMRLHLADATVQARCAQALGGIAEQGAAGVMTGNKRRSIIRAVEAAARAHKGSKAVQKQCRYALKHLRPHECSGGSRPAWRV